MFAWENAGMLGLAVSVLDLVFDRENILDGNMEYFRYVPRQHQRRIVSALFQVPDGFSANAHELCQSSCFMAYLARYSRILFLIMFQTPFFFEAVVSSR